MGCSVAEARMGVTTRLGFAVSNPASPPTQATYEIEFMSASIAEETTLTDTTGIRGTVGMPVNRPVKISSYVQGGFECEPTPDDAAFLLPYILGGTATGTTTKTYPVAETLPCLDVFQVKGDYLFVYRECQVSGATISGSEQQPVRWSVRLLGKQGDTPDDTFTWPSITADMSGQPWVFPMGVLNLDPAGAVTAANYSFRNFSMSLDNMLTPRFLNSYTPTEFVRTGRMFTFGCDRPWGGGGNTILTAMKTASSIATVLSFTGVSKVLTMTMPYCKPARFTDPQVAGRQEIEFPFQLQARYGVTTGDELVTTIGPTP